MTKITQLKILNALLAILILNQGTTALFNAALSHEMFEVMHVGSGAALFLGIMLHLILNWNWVKVNYFKRKR